MVYTALLPSLLGCAARLLLPPRCVACQEPGNVALPSLTKVPLDLCRDCFNLLPLNRHACLRCAIPLPGTTPDLVCGACLRRPPLFHRACCVLRYEYPANHLIQQLKFANALPQARVLAALLAQHLNEHYTKQQLTWPDCIVPVPLHARRYRERGYNQVIEVAAPLAKHLGIPLHTDVLIRTRHTPEQSGLSRKERRRNLRGAFAVASRSLPNHIAILDDVITTTSTVGEISKLLRKAGVAQIDVWGVARAQ
jgi:ComF family protein